MISESAKMVASRFRFPFAQKNVHFSIHFDFVKKRKAIFVEKKFPLKSQVPKVSKFARTRIITLSSASHDFPFLRIFYDRRPRPV